MKDPYDPETLDLEIWLQRKKPESEQRIKSMRVYLAGPMQGVPEFNFPAFHKAAAALRAAGHEVFNPAERDIKEHGDAVFKSRTGKLEDIKDTGFSLREALGADTHYICMEADTIALLPEWEYSSGAFAEWSLGRAFRHGFLYLKLVNGEYVW